MEPPPPPPKCDHCTAASAAVYCGADSANLCLLCDRVIHSANTLSLKHVRNPIRKPEPDTGSFDRFSGSPSSAELASLLNIAEEDEVYGQLIRLGRWDLEEKESTDHFGPKTPSLCGNVDGLELDLDLDLGRPNMPLTSLLMSSSGGKSVKSNCVNGAELLWDFDHAYQSADQLWDYPWERSLDMEEPSCTSDRVSEDLCEMDCSANFKPSQDNKNQTLDDQYMVHISDYSVPSIEKPSEPELVEPETFDGEPSSIMELPYWKKPMSKVDIEQLAEKRGRAMLRYKEKKKTRSFHSTTYIDKKRRDPQVGRGGTHRRQGEGTETEVVRAQL